MHMHLVIQCDSVATINGCCFIGFRFYVINIEKLGRNYINRAATICTLIVVVNGKLYLSHLGKKGNEYLSHPTKPL